MANRWNQYNFSTLHRLSIWGHRWILVPLLIFVDWYKLSNTIVVGFKCIFISILVYNLKTKSDLLSKCPHHIMGYIINLGSMIFLFSLVLNLSYIDYFLCQIWSKYMQYLQCCDHYNKCLFLVTQQAEVLNFFEFYLYIHRERDFFSLRGYPSLVLERLSRPRVILKRSLVVKYNYTNLTPYYYAPITVVFFLFQSPMSCESDQ